MAQIKFEQLTNEWTALDDIISVDADTTYYIQNRGADTLVALESSTDPTENNQEGIMCQPYKVLQYKKNEQNLYLRAFNRSCAVNITSNGAGGGSGGDEPTGLLESLMYNVVQGNNPVDTDQLSDAETALENIVEGE